MARSSNSDQIAATTTRFQWILTCTSFLVCLPGDQGTDCGPQGYWDDCHYGPIAAAMGKRFALSV
jgi:hypothetical protein